MLGHFCCRCLVVSLGFALSLESVVNVKLAGMKIEIINREHCKTHGHA